jgi:hypothetical protein
MLRPHPSTLESLQETQGEPDGINVWFGAAPTSQEDEDPVAHTYRIGDYWLIPARTATGDIEWPVDENDNPKLMGPHGVEHHYAALAVLQADGTMNDCLGSGDA